MNRKFWENQRDLVTDTSHLFENTQSVTKSKATESIMENNPYSKGDFYYLGKKIEEIRGDSVIETLSEIPMFIESFKTFQDPNINTGYNVILLIGSITSGVQGITTDKFDKYQTQDLYDKYKERGEVYNKLGLSKDLYESTEFQKTLSENKGLIVITINEKLYKKNPKEWYRVKNQSETVAHEFIIHAMRRILENPRDNGADHKYYFSDTKLGVIFEDEYSPNEQYLLEEAPNAPWANFYRQLNKVIDEKYPKNTRIKYE